MKIPGIRSIGRGAQAKKPAKPKTPAKKQKVAKAELKKELPKTGLAAADENQLIAMIRAGVLTWSEIGRHFGVTCAAVRQWAKRRDVEYGDLGASVKAATQAVASGTMAQETLDALANPAVAAAAASNLAIIATHRSDMEALRSAHADGLDKLKLMAANINDLGAAVKFFSAIEAATRTTRHLIEKERQAYGISDDGDGEDDGVVHVTVKKYS